jgi:hypothetical protein
MSRSKLIDLLWVLLVALTLSGSWLGETAEPGLGVVMFVCLTMAFKGRIVIDHFMELKTANSLLRRLMRVYFYVLPLLTLFVYLFGDLLARVATI